jgi:hypothetical protein
MYTPLSFGTIPKDRWVHLETSLDLALGTGTAIADGTPQTLQIVFPQDAKAQAFHYGFSVYRVASNQLAPKTMLFDNLLLELQ